MPPDDARLATLENQVENHTRIIETIDGSLRDISRSLQLLAKIEAHSEAHSQQLERIETETAKLEDRVRSLEDAANQNKWITRITATALFGLLTAVGAKALAALGLA